MVFKKIYPGGTRLDNGMVFKKVYPGGMAEEIAWNTQKVLENKDIDSVILNMGSNNISSKHTLVKTEIEIVNNR